ncbi:hypothetical protein CEXT_404271 [Caerostris extrusa]|uniref:Uncharacterized protein n=1 Tax=Caerostris extrusa TaxID=172846 RepID=A0AAV4QHD5_CAEEX|nr:hypothetical protein CEXT_404271 [Caerostris extrusa]
MASEIASIVTLRCQTRPPALIRDLIAYLNSNSDDKKIRLGRLAPEHKEHQSFFPREVTLDKHRRRC